MRSIRVMLVDDHQLMRQGLRAILAMEEDITIVGEASDGREFLHKIEQGIRPDVVLMDVQMPGISGVVATRRVAELAPEVRVLALTALDDEEVAARMLSAGAVDVLLKATAASKLVGAIRDAADGRASMTGQQRVAGRSACLPPLHRHQKHSDDLTRREREVMRVLLEGRTNKEIAQNLVISERTVQTHLSNIFSKLAVSSRTEAVLVAMRDGWVESELTL